MFKFLLILTCLLLPGLQTDWFTVHGVKERYRVDFPGRPGKDSSHAETSVYYYVPDKQTGDKNFDYTFIYTRAYNMHTYDDMLRALNVFAGSMIEVKNGRETSAQWTKYGIFPGKIVTGTYEDGKNAIMIRTYDTAPDFLYGMIVTCPIADTANANAKRFFDSFYLKD